MKPVSLSLEGYGSYREPQTVDFTPVRLACITGPNGAGKSSLFDAVSWALLGITRTGDIDQLVSEGATSATVALVFDHDGDRWRITRSRSRGKKTTARLEREVGGQFDQVEGPGVRAVDNALAALLRIDAETFASTVLLAQGDSGHFAEADPAQRKRVLGDILGLDRYSALARTAREHARQAKGRYEALTRQLADIDLDLAAAAAVQEQLDAAVGRVESGADRIAGLRAAVAELDSRVAGRQQAAERLATLRLRLTDAEAAAAKALAAARSTAEQADRQCRQAEQAVTTASARHAAALTATETATRVAGELSDLSTRRAAVQEELGAVLEAGQRAREEITALTAKSEQLSTAVGDLGERIATLSKPGSGCFTCGADLDDSRRAELLSDLGGHLDGARAALDATEAARDAAEGRRTQLIGRHRALDGQNAELGQAIDALRGQLTRAEAEASNVEAYAAEVAQCEQRLSAATAQRAAADAAAAAATDCPQVTELKGDIAALETQLGADVQAQRETAAAELAAIEGEHAALLAEVGGLRERLAGYDGLRSKRADVERAAAASAADAEDYTTLAQAFGPDGIPHLVFSGVVAELERDADELMTTLTDGQFRLELRTTATAKASGQTTETLDVIVATPTGERPYSALSGGERFRVDLALRVALSRLLSRRSGSSIELLALDEGWGALDPDGIRGMLDALRSVHDEFGLVLTITHTPEVAAAFDARYEVARDGDGTSVVSLVAA